MASGSDHDEWTVTSQVQPMHAGSDNAFLIRDATRTAAAWSRASTAADNPPQLVVAFG